MKPFGRSFRVYRSITCLDRMHVLPGGNHRRVFFDIGHAQIQKMLSAIFIRNSQFLLVSVLNSEFLRATGSSITLYKCWVRLKV